jgi:predicted metal-dependent hydrolase
VTDAELHEEAVRLFNHQQFFESHEVWEELWNRLKGKAREEMQGLIQVAVALHHAKTGNNRGAAALLARAERHLATTGGQTIGIDGPQLLHEATACIKATSGDERRWPRLIPKTAAMPDSNAAAKPRAERG